jgi:hypothetical protein
MPNEFVIKNGFISKGNSIVEGGLTATTISATTYSNLPSSPIIVGTTQITSGTDGRVLFQSGTTLQQDGAFNWDNTNKRLGIGANATSPSAVLFVRTNLTTANDILYLQNGQYGNPIFRVRDNATASQSTIGSVYFSALIYGGDSGVTRRFDLGGFGLGASFGDSSANAVWENNQGNIGDGQGTSVIAVSSNLYVNQQTTKKYKFEAVTGHFGIGNVGTLGARLDVRAQGTLSTDIAFRVRNSTDTTNIFNIRGNNNIEYLNGASGGILISRTDTYNSARIQLYNAFGSQVIIDGGNDVIATKNIRSSANITGDGYLGIVNPTSQDRYIKFVNLFGQESLSIGGNNYDGIATMVIKGSLAYDSNLIRVCKLDNTNNFVVSDKANVALGGTTFGTSSKFVLAQYTGTAPTTSPTDAFQQYSADIVAGNAVPHFRTENGSIVKLYQNANTVAIDDVLVNIGLRASGGTSNFSNSISATTISATTFNLSGSQIDTLWTSYTPTWTASSSNPSIGNGTIEGYYKLIGKTCFVRGNIAMGSTTTFGSGEWYVELPFPAKHADGILMTANLLDNGTAWFNAVLNGARAGFNTKAPIQYQGGAGTALDVNATQPFTWTNTDRFLWNGSYEIA